MSQNKFSRRTRAELARAPLANHPTGVKQCRKCLAVLPLSAFYNSRGDYDALTPRCKPCTRASIGGGHAPVKST